MTADVGFFKDAEGTIPLLTIVGTDQDGAPVTGIDMGEMEVGSSQTLSFFVKNTGTEKLRSLSLESTFPNAELVAYLPDLLLSGQVVPCNLTWSLPIENNPGLIVGEIRVQAVSIGE